MKKIMLVILISFVGLTIQAQETKNKNAKLDIEVNGKKRIEKAAFSVKGVKSAEWHIDDHMLHLILNEEKCSALDVKKAVAKVGHDTDEVKAKDDDYNKLHGCCKFERK
jgi:periplasmic mercuric ion binding protein